MKTLHEAVRALLAALDSPWRVGVEQAVKDLRAAAANNGWRSIESCPPWPALVIEHCPEPGQPPTHWQPLPPPPDEEPLI